MPTPLISSWCLSSQLIFYMLANYCHFFNLLSYLIIGFFFFQSFTWLNIKWQSSLDTISIRDPKLQSPLSVKAIEWNFLKTKQQMQVLNCSLPFSRSQPDISLALTNLSFLRRRRSCWWTTIVSTYVSMDAK